MPVMNGLEMLERMREDSTLAHLPVLLMTTEVDERLIERARKAGSKGWFVKPVKPDHLLMTVKRLVD
jgi:two-component system chemotaxis response regulator CheY